MTESSFLKSHKQYIKRHLNHRHVKPVPFKYPCGQRIRSRNSREHYSGPDLADKFITFDQPMIEVMYVIDARMKGSGTGHRRPKSLKWIKGGWR